MADMIHMDAGAMDAAAVALGVHAKEMATALEDTTRDSQKVVASWDGLTREQYQQRVFHIQQNNEKLKTLATMAQGGVSDSREQFQATDSSLSRAMGSGTIRSA